jgi:hypothetical protein
MKLLALVSAAATATMLLLSPASAQNGSWDNGRNYQNNWNNNGWNDNGRYQNGNWQRQGRQDGYTGRGWNSRGVSGHFSDPSYNSDVRFRANPNRCTEDLGYGRYEYCGW